MNTTTQVNQALTLTLNLTNLHSPDSSDSPDSPDSSCNYGRVRHFPFQADPGGS